MLEVLQSLISLIQAVVPLIKQWLGMLAYMLNRGYPYAECLVLRRYFHGVTPPVQAPSLSSSDNPII
jgi:hypothetical protein